MQTPVSVNEKKDFIRWFFKPLSVKAPRVRLDLELLNEP